MYQIPITKEMLLNEYQLQGLIVPIKTKITNIMAPDNQSVSDPTDE